MKFWKVFVFLKLEEEHRKADSRELFQIIKDNVEQMQGFLDDSFEIVILKNGSLLGGFVVSKSTN